MAIISSSYSTDSTNWTIEKHTDSVGVVHQMVYQWDGIGDRDAMMAARATALNTQLAEAEADALIANGA